MLRVNFNDITALDTAAQSGLGDLGAKPYQMKVSERENHVLSNIASFFGMVTAPRLGSAGGIPKPLSAFRMMTTEDERRSFFGPNRVLTKSFTSMRAAGMELRALVGRQAAAIRLLLALLAYRGGAAAPIAIAEAIAPSAPIAAGAPGGAPPPPPPPPSSSAAAAAGPRSAGPPPPAPAAPTLDELRPLLRAALKILTPRNLHHRRQRVSHCGACRTAGR